MYLRHLSVSGFRGIGSCLDLPFDHRTIFYGPNGSGKSSIFQTIAWAVYGKLPILTGRVFAREDALVNDFLTDARAEVALGLSNAVTITRTRNKRNSTGRGKNPLYLSVETDDPQAAVEQLIGLSLEEFFAAVFLQQETIRDFITTTPEKRSATIDRMLGTYLLRTLIRVVDPRVPAKAIEQAETAIKQLDRQLSQASVISREVIQKRKEEYGDPAKLPELLQSIRLDLVPLAERLRLPAPEATPVGLEKALELARQAQLNTIAALQKKVGQLGALKERYRQASVTGWQPIHERRDRYGDPGDLPSLLREIQQDLAPVAKVLSLPIPEPTIDNLAGTLASAPQTQLATSTSLERRAGQLGALKERYKHLSQEAIEDVSVPTALRDRRTQIQDQIEALNRDISALTRQLNQREATERDLGELRLQVQALPGLRDDAEDIQRELQKLEAAQRQGTLYNQILGIGQEYLEQAQPEHCPLCKQRIADLRALLETLRQETPVATERILQEHKRLHATLVQAQKQIADLVQKQRLIKALQTRLMQIPERLDAQIEAEQKKSQNLTTDLTKVQAEITRIEGRIKLATEHHKRLDSVLRDIKQALERRPGESVMHALEQAIQAARQRASEVQALEIQPIADKLNRARQLDQMRRDEAKLRRQLNAVLKQVNQALGQALGEDVATALDQAIEAVGKHVIQIRGIDLRSVSANLHRARQLHQIREDEDQLRQFESNYQTATREKSRLRHRIQRLTELRNALQDIAQTTKRHQRTIVAGILSELDIHRYYRQLDPHPVYRQLQIEPELTSKGIYNYWIKALTDDHSYGTYVRTRFSTAQANCVAIAIFLAINQHLSKRLETVILDDPSQSMDPEHMMRLAHTLADMPRQVIVATEDPEMFRCLVDAFDTPTIYQLEPWTVNGASLVR